MQDQDIDALWNFDDPAQTEDRFQKLIAEVDDDANTERRGAVFGEGARSTLARCVVGGERTCTAEVVEGIDFVIGAKTAACLTLFQHPTQNHALGLLAWA